MKEKMVVPNITPKQWNARDKAKVFYWIAEYYIQISLLGEAVVSYNDEFFKEAIRICEEELKRKDERE